MVDWWFNYLDTTEKYEIWEPKSHISLEWDENWKPGHYIGAAAIVKQDIEGDISSARIHFHDPSEFLDTYLPEGSETATAICANVYDLEKIPLCRFIHFVRDTDFGCEMRSRFWLFKASDLEAMGLMKYCMEEMGRLADILPGLYAREQANRRERAIV
jgi:hypothetical protein